MEVEVAVHDIVLFNVLSFLVGVFSGLGISMKYCRENVNHDHPREIGATYQFSPGLTPLQPSAPPPFNLNENVVEAHATSSAPGKTEIVINSK
jgi:hypothetical protein|tara:strand:- start:529 stop:807 length:279 start_codon:yes stop_codon:yes gene_type:complete